MRSLKLREIPTEGEVQSLGWEVTDDVCSVTTPEGDKTLITVRANEAVTDTLVRRGKAALLNLVDNVSKTGTPLTFKHFTISSYTRAAYHQPQT